MEQHVTEDFAEKDTDFEQGQEIADNNTKYTVSQMEEKIPQIDPTEITTRDQNEAENRMNDIEQGTDFSLKAGQIVKYKDGGILKF